MHAPARNISLAFLLVALSVGLAAAEECSESCITCSYFAYSSCSTEPTADIKIPGCWAGDGGGYNIPFGTLYATAVDPFGCCGVRSTVDDEFLVTGLPAGTPITLFCKFQVTVTAGCILGPGYAAAGLQEVGGEALEFEWDVTLFQTSPRDTNLVLTLETEAGIPFHLRYFVQTRFGECNGATVGQFSFSGLPDEATVVSCNGFIDGPVQTGSSTWGRIKAGYR